MTINIFGGIKVLTFVSKESEVQLLERLKSICDTRKPIGFYDYPKHIMFVGTIRGSSFRLTPMNFRRNAALPQLVGSIDNVNGLTTVRLRIRLNDYLPLIVIVLAVVFVNILELSEYGHLNFIAFLPATIMTLLIVVPYQKQRTIALQHFQQALQLTIAEVHAHE